MRRRALLPFAALAAFATLAASCLESPTLPLPPPDVPDYVAQNTTGGLWQVLGQCVAGATVSVLDQQTGRGAIYEDLANAGTYHVAISGTLCDVVVVWQESSEGVSSATPFLLEASANGVPVDPTACGGQ